MTMFLPIGGHPSRPETMVAAHHADTSRGAVSVVVCRIQYQSAPGHFSRRVSGNWLARVMRHSSLRAPLASSFFPETGGTFLRGLVNFCRDLPGWSVRIVCASTHACQQAARVLIVFAGPHPFVGAVRLHARNKSMEMEAWRAEKQSIRSVK